jgi:solute carrier family 8 (sodium/calcium exchanger)
MCFTCLQGTIHFGPGETEREIVIPIIDDDMSEPDVTFTMLLSGAVGEAVYIVQPTVPVTIVDDDDGGMLTFELPTFEVRDR